MQVSGISCSVLLLAPSSTPCLGKQIQRQWNNCRERERERERARAAAAAPRSGVDQSPFCAISHSLLPFKTTRTVGSQSVNYEVMHCKKISESGMHQHMESPAWEKDWINMDKHGINRKRVKLNPRPSNPLHPSQLVKGRTNSCRTSLPSTEAPKS